MKIQNVPGTDQTHFQLDENDVGAINAAWHTLTRTADDKSTAHFRLVLLVCLGAKSLRADDIPYELQSIYDTATELFTDPSFQDSMAKIQ